MLSEREVNWKIWMSYNSLAVPNSLTYYPAYVLLIHKGFLREICGDIQKAWVEMYPGTRALSTLDIAPFY
jgi:hypothetical protein